MAVRKQNVELIIREIDSAICIMTMLANMCDIVPPILQTAIKNAQATRTNLIGLLQFTLEDD